MGGFVTIKCPNAEKLSYFRLLMMSSLQEFLVILIILIHCKFEHFNQNYSKILTNFAENLPFLKR